MGAAGRELQKLSCSCRNKGGGVWLGLWPQEGQREQIPRSLLARTFPIPTLRFRMGPLVNARSLRSVGMTRG